MHYYYFRVAFAVCKLGQEYGLQDVVLCSCETFTSVVVDSNHHVRLNGFNMLLSEQILVDFAAVQSKNDSGLRISNFEINASDFFVD